MGSDGGDSVFVSTMQPPVIEWEEGWNYIQTGITKLKGALDEFSEPHFSIEEQVMLYTTVHNMCIQNPGYNHSRRLYVKYRETFVEYITSTVLSSLTDKQGELLLQEIVKRWKNQKVMVRWLSSFFRYLECYYVPKRSFPPLKVVGLICFRDLVYLEVSDRARLAVISLINKEREGDQHIDRALLKNFIDMLVDIRVDEMKNAYEVDLEEYLLRDTGEYYARKASHWIVEDSCPDYILKAEECLRRERDRVSHYLHSSSEQKLVETVQHELLVVYATQLLEKEHSGFRALLRDDEVEHLSKMYRLYHEIPGGLESLASLFKLHVTAEVASLVQQAEDAASNQSSNGAGVQERQVLVTKISELHETYMAYAKDCFKNHSLFHNAIKEAFEVICNKSASESSSAVLCAAFCDDILPKGGSEKLIDEALEERLETVVNLQLP